MFDLFAHFFRRSIFGRLADGFVGAAFGVALIVGSIVLLFWNEGRAVKTEASLKEGAASVVSVSSDARQAENDRKLIHLTGEASTRETLEDPVFHVGANAIRLKRTVEMYQWKEEEKTPRGGSQTEKTYTYTKVWSDRVIPSTHFEHPEGHENPASMAASQQSTVTNAAAIGAFQLPRSIIERMPCTTPLEVTDDGVRRFPAELRSKAKCVGEYCFFGNDSSAPQIGDQRVRFTVLRPGTYSVIARQTGNTLEPYPTKAGRFIERVEAGAVSAEAMFQHDREENASLTGFLRLAGVLVMAFAFRLSLQPLATLADVLPLIGDLMEVGVTFAAFILAAVSSSVVISVSWFAVRPLLSSALILGAAGAYGWGRWFGASSHAQR